MGENWLFYNDLHMDGPKRSSEFMCEQSGGDNFPNIERRFFRVSMAEYIFNYDDKCIEKVGPKKMVQVVTNNASKNMATVYLTMEKRPNIFCTSCAIPKPHA